MDSSMLRKTARSVNRRSVGGRAVLKIDARIIALIVCKVVRKRAAI